VRGLPGAVLYTRRACPLCYEIGRLAGRSSRRYRVALAETDVDNEPALLERYGTRVPVLVLPGGGSLAGRATAWEVDEAFRRAARFLRDLEDGARTGAASPGLRSSSARFQWLRRLLGLDRRPPVDGTT
jgi:glutaredoxin-like protein DUF836